MSRGIFLSCVLSAACLFGIQCAQTLATSTDSNDQFDEIISTIATFIEDSDLSTFSIPDMTLLDGMLTLTGGELKNLSSLARTGDAEVTTSSNSTTIKGSITFSTLEVDFENLTIALSVFPTIGGGSASISFGTNAIYLDLTIETESSTSCPLTINEISLSALSGISLSFGKFSIFNLMAQYLAPIYLNTFTSVLVSLVGDSPTTVAEFIFGSINLCST